MTPSGGSLRGQAASAYGLTAAMLVSNLVTGVLIARGLGAVGRGEFAAIVAIPNIAAWIVAFGCAQAVSFFQARDPTRGRDLLATWGVVLGGTGAVGVASLELVLPHLYDMQSSQTLWLARLFAGMVFSSLITELSFGLLLGDQDFRFVNRVRAGQPLAQAIGYAALLCTGSLTVGSALLVCVGVAIAINVLSLSRAIRRHGVGRPSRRLARESLSYGLRAYGATLGDAANQRLDLLLLPAFIGAASIGLYSVAVGVAAMVTTLAAALAPMTLPAAARRRENAAQTVLTAFVATVVAGIALSAATAVVARVAVSAVYGHEFEGSVELLYVLLPGAVLYACALVLVGGLNALNVPGRGLAAQCSGAVVTVSGLSLVLPRGGGAAGAATITTLAYASVFGVALGFFMVQVRPTRRAWGEATHVVTHGVGSMAAHMVKRVLTARKRLVGQRRAPLAAATCATAVLAGLLGAGSAVVLDAEAIYFGVGLLATTCVCLGGAAFAARRSRDVLGPATLLGWFFLMNGVAGGIYFSLERPAIYALAYSPAFIPLAMAICAVAAASALLGVMVTPLGWVRRWLPGPPQIEIDRLAFVVAGALGIGWAARTWQLHNGGYFHETFGNAGGNDSVIGVLAGLPSLAALIVYAAGKSRAPATRWLARALIVLEVAWYLPTGERSAVVGVAVGVLVARYYRDGRLPWLGMAAVGVAVVLLVFPVVQAFRDAGAAGQADPIAAIRVGAAAQADGGLGAAAVTGIRTTMVRFVATPALAAVIEQGRNKGRQAALESLVSVPASVVPRALAGSKSDPTEFDNVAGRTYRLLYQTDKRTRFATGATTQLYIALGLGGVVLGMLIIGAMFAVLGEWLRQRADGDPGAVGLYAVASYAVVHGLEQNVAAGAVGALKTVATYAVILGCLNGARRLGFGAVPSAFPVKRAG